MVGWHDAARRRRLAVLHRRQLDGHRHAGRLGRRDRAVLGGRRRCAAQRRELQHHRHAHGHAPPDLDATATMVSSPTSESARRSPCASTDRRWSTRCSRARPTSATTTSSLRSTRSTPTRSPSATRDTEPRPRQLLADAGFPDGIKATLNAVDLQEIPQLAELVQIQAAEGGFDARAQRRDRAPRSTTPSGASRYPCAGSAELGIVDYGHRATPDVYLLKAFRSGGDWNSSQYKSADLDAAILEYQASADLDARTAACEKIETIMLEDTPAAIPYFYNYLGGHSKSVHRRSIERTRPDAPRHRRPQA